MRRSAWIGVLALIMALASGLARSPGNAGAASAAAPKLLWTNSDTGTIGAANLDGSAVNQSLIAGDPNGTGVAADAQHVYWTNRTTNSIGEANLDGTGVIPDLVSHGNQPAGVALDAQHIYWADEGNGTIGRANLDGSGADQQFITGLAHPLAIAVDGGHVYWSDAGTGAIGRADLAGTHVDPGFIPNVAQPVSVAVDGQHIYWANSGAFAIGRARLDGSAVEPQFITTADFPAGVAVDGQHIYWANYTLGTIARASLDGSNPDQSFITGAQKPFALAISLPPGPTGPPAGSPGPGAGGLVLPDPTSPLGLVPQPRQPAQPPAGAQRASARASAIGSRLLLNRARSALAVEMRCDARTASACLVHAVLTGRVHGRRLALASLSTRLPGRRITSVWLPLSAPAALPLGGVLTIHSASPHLRPVTVTVRVSIQPLAPGTPPGVTTEQASGIASPGPTGAGSAVLAGTVNPQGEPTQYHFEIGWAAGAYITARPNATAIVPADRLTHLVTVGASGLDGGLTYHYRVVAENGSGTSYGPDRSLTVPLVPATPQPPPVGDVTQAGPVSLSLAYSCVPAAPAAVTGATILCLLTATNPQPSVVPVAPLGWGAVRPASVVLEAAPPPGTHLAPGSSSQLPLVIAPGGAGVAAASFQVDHPAGPVSFVASQAYGTSATSAVTPGTARVHLQIGCRLARHPVGVESCTITTTNAGDDSADFMRFEIQPSRELADPQTVAGAPPVVLPPGRFSQTTVRFRLRSASRHAAAPVTISAHGQDETDRRSFLVTTSSAASAP